VVERAKTLVPVVFAGDINRCVLRNNRSSSPIHRRESREIKETTMDVSRRVGKVEGRGQPQESLPVYTPQMLDSAIGFVRKGGLRRSNEDSKAFASSKGLIKSRAQRVNIQPKANGDFTTLIARIGEGGKGWANVRYNAVEKRTWARSGKDGSGFIGFALDTVPVGFDKALAEVKRRIEKDPSIRWNNLSLSMGRKYVGIDTDGRIQYERQLRYTAWHSSEWKGQPQLVIDAKTGESKLLDPPSHKNMVSERQKGRNARWKMNSQPKAS